MVLESTQPLTKINTKNLSGGEGGRRIGPTAFQPSERQMSENVGASTSRNPKGLHDLYRDNLPLPFDILYYSWPTQGMDASVCVYDAFVLFCAGSGLATS
jgi:hypothetical protein